MPKPNYGFQKRQKELAKQQKRAEKLERRQAREEVTSNSDSELPPQITEPSPE